MKSITLHNLEPDLADALEKRARAEGRSLNRTAQDLLRSGLSIDRDPRRDRAESFRDLFGTWDEAEAREFAERVAPLRRVDPAEWGE